METFVMRLSPKGHFVFNIILSIVGALLWLVIAWYSAQVTWDLYQEKWRIFSILDPLKALIVGIIPVGSFLLSIQLMRDTYRFLTSKIPEKSESQQDAEEV